MTQRRTICTFFVGDLFLGVDVERVQEIIRYQDITSVPLAPKVIAGMINLRGEIVVAIDLHRRLGLPPGPGHSDTSVVITHEGASVSLLIDDIGDVHIVEQASIEPPPQTVAPPTREVVSGVCKLDEGLLLILDVPRVVSVGPPETEAARAA